MKSIIYYYSATGNSLYAAGFLRDSLPETELRPIPECLYRNELAADAERVGFVFPMHYFGLPMQVEEFLEKLTIHGSPYLFAVVTCGVPYWGRPFLDADEILGKKGHKLCASWFLRLVSNYLPLRDTAADWRIAIRARLAERKLRKIGEAIRAGEGHDTWQLMREFCKGHHDRWKERQAGIDEAFICDTEKCISCGMCEGICPRGNIVRPDGPPVWQHDCVECLGCLHICPVEAIDFGEITKGRKRYRHKDIKPAELLQRYR